MRLALLILTLTVCWTANAATLATTRTKVDNWLANAWQNVIVPRQQTYYAANGRYWQGLLSCAGGVTNCPAFTTASDGDAPQNNLASKPHYQNESIADAFPALQNVSLPCSFSCDQYRGPAGDGFVVTVWVSFNGTTYTRSQNYGPETWRTQSWSVWTPGTLPTP